MTIHQKNNHGFMSISLIALVVLGITLVSTYLILAETTTAPATIPNQQQNPPPHTTSTTPTPPDIKGIQTPTAPVITQPLPETTPSPTKKGGDITEIQSQLKNQAWVLVVVTLEGNEFTTPEARDDAKRYAEVKRIQDTVLTTLTESDFKLSAQYTSVTSFAGKVSSSGMSKLLNNPLVTSISIDKLSAPTH